jgi:hypothetical protein
MRQAVFSSQFHCHLRGIDRKHRIPEMGRVAVVHKADDPLTAPQPVAARRQFCDHQLDGLTLPYKQRDRMSK